MSRFAPVAWAALGAGVLSVALFAGGTLTPPAAAPEAAAPAATEPLALTPDQQKLTGVRVAVLQTLSVATERKGFARALDIGALAAIASERTAAAAALQASQAEVVRLQALYAADQSASLHAVEAARAQAAADRARLALAERRTGLEFGAGLARLGPGGASALIGEVAGGRAALIRIDMPGVPLFAGQPVTIGSEGETAVARILGPASQGDAKLQTPGALAIVRGATAQRLPIGRIVPASVSGGTAKTGVFVPSSAIVRWQGARWVFRQTAKDFERVEVTGGEAVTGGWLVSEGLAAGDRIAVEGAGSLLAAERGGGDETE